CLSRPGDGESEGNYAATRTAGKSRGRSKVGTRADNCVPAARHLSNSRSPCGRLPRRAARCRAPRAGALPNTNATRTKSYTEGSARGPAAPDIGPGFASSGRVLENAAADNAGRLALAMGEVVQRAAPAFFSDQQLFTSGTAPGLLSWECGDLA